MKSETFISAKIYLDSSSGYIDPEVGFAGIDMLAQHAAILPQTNIGRVWPASHRTDYLNVDHWTIPETSADINFVLTRRKIVTNEHLTRKGNISSSSQVEGEEIVGYSKMKVRRAKAITRFAFIDVDRTDNPEIFVAHEGGHLLGIEPQSEDKLHCEDDKCIMTKVIDEDDRGIDYCNNCQKLVEFHALNLIGSKALRSMLRDVYPEHYL